MKRFVYALVALGILGPMIHSCTSASRSGNSATEKNIFGADDRIPMKSKKYPWSAIGRLDFYKARDETGFYAQAHCTAFLIGRSTILTNAHCVVDSQTGKSNTDHKLRLNLQGSDALATLDAQVSQMGSAKAQSFDWAILKVAGNPGEAYGWFEIATKEFMEAWVTQHHSADNSNNFAKRVVTNLILAGYSGDFQSGLLAGVHMSCHLRGINMGGSNLLHNCDMNKGASGAPIFAWNLSLGGQGAQLFALNNAQKTLGDGATSTPDYSDKTANLAVRTEKFLREVNTELANDVSLNGTPKLALKDVIARIGMTETPQ